MKIGIITVDYNNHKDTLDLINSAKNLQKGGAEIRWFIVDNASSSYLGKVLPEKKNIEILQAGTNLGFSGGYNYGIKYALCWGSHFLLIINNDTLITDPQLVIKLIAAFKKKRDAGIVSPKILFAPGYEYHRERYLPKELGKVIWWAGGSIDWDNVQTVHRGIDLVDQGQYNQLEKTQTVSGCCMMVKREVFEKVGLFDEKLFAYFEDTDFVLRAKKAGFESYLQGRAYLHHKVSQTTGIGSPLADYLITRNRLYFGLKYAPLKNKKALVKHSLSLLLQGRPQQKEGVIAFFKGKMGSPPTNLFPKKTPSHLQYPRRLSIIIVHYRTKRLTLNLLKSILKKNSGFNFQKDEIILLDNGSHDNIEESISKHFPKVKFIACPQNIGFARGYNKAIDYSKGKYLLLLNSDIEVFPGSIKKLITVVKKKNNLAVATGKLILPNGKPQKSCFCLPTISGAIKEYFLNIPHSYSQFCPKEEKKPVIVEGAVMAVFLIPRKVFNQVGKLSEKTFIYFEDIDYCRRLKRKKIPIYFHPQAKFYHHHGASSKKLKGGAKQYLNHAAQIYHGKIKNKILSFILWVGQKFHPLAYRTHKN